MALFAYPHPHNAPLRSLYFPLVTGLPSGHDAHLLQSLCSLHIMVLHPHHGAPLPSWCPSLVIVLPSSHRVPLWLWCSPLQLLCSHPIMMLPSHYSAPLQSLCFPPVTGPPPTMVLPVVTVLPSSHRVPSGHGAPLLQLVCFHPIMMLPPVMVLPSVHRASLQLQGSPLVLVLPFFGHCAPLLSWCSPPVTVLSSGHTAYQQSPKILAHSSDFTSLPLPLIYRNRN